MADIYRPGTRASLLFSTTLIATALNLCIVGLVILGHDMVFDINDTTKISEGNFVMPNTINGVVTDVFRLLVRARTQSRMLAHINTSVCVCVGVYVFVVSVCVCLCVFVCV